MKIVVGVAEMKMSTSTEDVIVTHGLGSCLGVTAYDPASRVGGMLHVMMPASTSNPDKARVNPFMFVDTGLPTFLERLGAAGAMRNRLRLKVVGGASVNGNDHFAIGRKNYLTLKKVLWKAGVLIDSEDVGGSTARTLYLSLDNGRVWMTKAGKEWEL